MPAFSTFSLQLPAIKKKFHKSLIINHKSRKGFTLVELLVAVSIVAVVSAIGYINYTTAQVSARDAKRKQDLQAMKVGLELYYQANKHYPCSPSVANAANVWTHSSSSTTSFAPWVEINDNVDTTITAYNCPTVVAAQVNFNKAFINVMPTDPLKNSGSPANVAANQGYSYYGHDLNNGLSFTNCGASFRKGKYYLLVTQLENASDPDAYGSLPAAQRNILCGGTQDPQFGPRTYIVAPDYH